MLRHTIGSVKIVKRSFEVTPLTQEELNALIKECKFKAGDVVAFKNYRGEIKHPGQCDIVVDIIDDVNKIEYQWGTGDPRFIMLMSCYVGHNGLTTPFHRLDTGKEIRKISGYHYQTVILPVYDEIQNRVKIARQAFADSKTACPA